MRRSLLVLIAAVLMAQTNSVISVAGTATGTGQSIPWSVSLTLSPSSVIVTCAPTLLPKGGTSACNLVLDQPVPAGMTLTSPIVAPTINGGTITVQPTSWSIAAGANSCGTATTPCFTATRQ